MLHHLLSNACRGRRTTALLGWRLEWRPSWMSFPPSNSRPCTSHLNHNHPITAHCLLPHLPIPWPFLLLSHHLSLPLPFHLLTHLPLPCLSQSLPFPNPFQHPILAAATPVPPLALCLQHLQLAASLPHLPLACSPPPLPHCRAKMHTPTSPMYQLAYPQPLSSC